jgi:sec-independent protein translocase protein TatA
MQIAALESLDVVLIVIAVGLLVFGSSKLPKIARGLGSAKSEFEKGIKEGHDKTAEDEAKDESKTDKPAT